MDRSHGAAKRLEESLVSAVMNGVIPLFAVILLGFGAGRLGWLPAEASRALSRFVFLFAMPIFLFDALAFTDPASLARPDLLLLMAGGSAVTFAALVGYGLLGGGARPDAVMRAVVSIWPNSLFLGMPAAIAVFGDQVAGPVALAAVFHFVVPVLCAVVGLSLSGAMGAGAWTTLRGQFLLNPFLWAAILGAGVSASGVGVPSPLATFSDLMASTAAPVALFSLGLFMADVRIRGLSLRVLVTVGAKLVLHPLATGTLAVVLGLWGSAAAGIAILMAAMPPAVASFIFAQQEEAATEETAAAVVLATALALVTVTAVSVLIAPPAVAV